MCRLILVCAIALTAVSGCANAIILGVMIADGVEYSHLRPQPDPTRAINAQDCTRPVDPSAGNLLCR